MPKTYTHIFDTPVYKADVTLNTGCVIVVYASHIYIHVASSLFIDGKWVDPVEGHTLECVPTVA